MYCDGIIDVLSVSIVPPYAISFHQAHGDSSRPVWLQVAESAYRFSLGAIAGGELPRGQRQVAV